MHRLAISLAFLVAGFTGTSCDKPASSSAAPGDAAPGGQAPSADDGAASGGSPSLELLRYAGWEQWPKMNDKRFVSKGHGRAWVDVYVSPEHVEQYKAGETAPVGMRVVKAQYKDEAGTKFSKLTTMEKVAPGYDPEHNDWYYGVSERDGTSEKNGGTIGYCRRCHDKVADRDYLFGTEE